MAVKPKTRRIDKRKDVTVEVNKSHDYDLRVRFNLCSRA